MLQRLQPWPPDYKQVYAWRQQQLLRMRQDSKLLLGAKEYYRTHCADFITHWCDTYDPRKSSTGELVRVPFILFKRQRELIGFLDACVQAQAPGLVEKSRDMGATWACCAYSVQQLLFVDGVAIGWGSRKQELVDHMGVMDSIFEKMRWLVRSLPIEFYPRGFDPNEHMYFMRIMSPATNSEITGECGDNIGRGGRKSLYFKDESAHYEHPESIEAALTDNTNVPIDISSVNGLGNVFHRKREAGIEWSPGKRAVRGQTNIFLMDWRDHPGKDEAWYRERRKNAEDNGLLHLFAQEVDRNYAAAVQGTIIPLEWIRSAIDAHKKIAGMDDGGWCAGLDVADEGMDRNALIKRKGVVLNYCEEWGERDTGATTRRMLSACEETTPIEVMYDCIGVGAGIKAETNRLTDEKLMPQGIKLMPWNAGAAILNPEKRVVEDDADSPLNKDFYSNLKAQAWWDVRRRFEKTHRAITKGIRYSPDELISISSELPKLRSLEKELAQPTMIKSTRMRLLVDKTPPGTRSPNMGDATVMCFFPITAKYDATMSWVG